MKRLLLLVALVGCARHATMAEPPATEQTPTPWCMKVSFKMDGRRRFAKLCFHEERTCRRIRDLIGAWGGKKGAIAGECR